MTRHLAICLPLHSPFIIKKESRRSNKKSKMLRHLGCKLANVKDLPRSYAAPQPATRNVPILKCLWMWYDSLQSRRPNKEISQLDNFNTDFKKSALRDDKTPHQLAETAEKETSVSPVIFWTHSQISGWS